MRQKQSKGHSELFVSCAIALGSGILMGLTVAPVNAWFLAWVALAPLWYLVVNPTLRPKPSPLLFALIWGIGYHGIALSWITGIHPMTWMGVPWLASIAIALFCWIFITLWGAASVALWATGMRIICQSIQKPYARVLIGTALWCGIETVLSWGALFWSSISYTQSPYNIVIL
ncbi:MAG: apolipoprotein N-acyltransferase, partial [Mastigocladus sp. ERB_26_1]